MATAKSTQLTAARLREVLHYDPTTGHFTWRVTRGSRCIAGIKAGFLNGNGYWKICLDRSKQYAHRLAWLYMVGHWPRGNIDHRNGDRLDNCWSNLRDVNQSINSQNQRHAMIDSKTGLLGASWDSRRKRFIARILVDGKYRHLGYFDTAQSAHAVYLAAKRRLHQGCTI